MQEKLAGEGKLYKAGGPTYVRLMHDTETNAGWQDKEDTNQSRCNS